jgi:hypothetical protein
MATATADFVAGLRIIAGAAIWPTPGRRRGDGGVRTRTPRGTCKPSSSSSSSRRFPRRGVPSSADHQIELLETGGRKEEGGAFFVGERVPPGCMGEGVKVPDSKRRRGTHRYLFDIVAFARRPYGGRPKVHIGGVSSAMPCYSGVGICFASVLSSVSLTDGIPSSSPDHGHNATAHAVRERAVWRVEHTVAIEG